MHIKMENLFLTAEKFEGRLNMDVFSNIEKSLTEEQLAKRYPEQDYLVFEKGNIDNFINDVYEGIGGEIQKGGFNDTKEANELIEKAKGDLAKMKPVKVRHNDVHRTVYVLEKAQNQETLKKGGSDGLIGEESTTGEKLEKGIVQDAFSYYNESIKFSKTGDEIKSKLMYIKDDCEKKCNEISNDIAECLKECKGSPTETYKGYGYSEMVVCPYKTFDWSQTYYDSDCGTVEASSGTSLQKCDTPEEAECNRKYNDLVYQWMDCSAEVKAIEMYEKNLEDKKSYDLTAKQMIALKF